MHNSTHYGVLFGSDFKQLPTHTHTHTHIRISLDQKGENPGAKIMYIKATLKRLLLFQRPKIPVFKGFYLQKHKTVKK